MIANRKNRKGRSKLNSFSLAVVVFVFYSALQISGGSCKPTETTTTKDPINRNLKSNETEAKREIPKAKISVRVLRSAGSPEAQQEIPRRSLFPPASTLMKKYAHNARMSKFHGGGGANIPTATRIIASGYSSPVAKLLVTRDNAMMSSLGGQDSNNEDGQGTGDGSLQEQDPTFTPYISARALSNIPNFFDEIRANLHALQMDEGDHSFDEEMDSEDRADEDEGSNVDISEGSPLRSILEADRYPEQKGLRWLPASFGARSRGSNIRHFVQHPNPMHNFNPARNAYEFGLG